MRRIASVLAAVAVVAALAGCSAEGGSINATFNNAVCGPYASGQSSDAITLKGSDLTKATFPTPLKVTSPQVTLLKSGSGAQLQTGAVARVEVAFYYNTGQRASQVLDRLVAVGGGGADLTRSLDCRRAGDRYAIVAPFDKLLGSGAGAQAGKSASTTLVAVIEVRKLFPGKADGVNQLQNNSLPAVVTAVDGQPGLVAPNAGPPSKDTSALVKAGGGAVIRKGDKAVVRLSAFKWTSSGITLDNDDTWTQGAAAAYEAGTASSEAPYAKELVGLRVGSQLLYVEAHSGGAEVYVVDVIGKL